jgi:enterochelin esterase-like enzyme
MYWNRVFVTMEDEDVIIVLDGDDWFSRKDVLKILDKTYKDHRGLP